MVSLCVSGQSGAEDVVTALLFLLEDDREATGHGGPPHCQSGRFCGAQQIPIWRREERPTLSNCESIGHPGRFLVGLGDPPAVDGDPFWREFWCALLLVASFMLARDMLGEAAFFTLVLPGQAFCSRFLSWAFWRPKNHYVDNSISSNTVVIIRE